MDIFEEREEDDHYQPKEAAVHDRLLEERKPWTIKCTARLNPSIISKLMAVEGLHLLFMEC